MPISPSFKLLHTSYIDEQKTGGDLAPPPQEFPTPSGSFISSPHQALVLSLPYSGDLHIGSALTIDTRTALQSSVNSQRLSFTTELELKSEKERPRSEPGNPHRLVDISCAHAFNLVPLKNVTVATVALKDL